MMNDSFPSFAKDMGVDFFGKSSYPKVDIIDTPDSLEIRAEIPGLTKDEVEIEVDTNNVLSIRGSKQTEEVTEKEKTYICKELKHSSFTRKFALGENLDGKTVSAKFKDGILEIEIPKLVKKEIEEPVRRIAIN
jgi:HSP20 family protein